MVTKRLLFHTTIAGLLCVEVGHEGSEQDQEDHADNEEDAKEFDPVIDVLQAGGLLGGLIRGKHAGELVQMRCCKIGGTRDLAVVFGDVG